MFSNIEKGPIRWPNETKHGVKVSPEAQDLIFKVPLYNLKLKLLDRNRQTRLGAVGDAEEVLAHPFFKDIDMK